MPAKLPRTLAICKRLVVLLAMTLACPYAMAADDPVALADTTPARVLSVVSGGYWEEKAAAPGTDKKAGDNGAAEDVDATAQKDLRGYYRSVAIRSADNTSRLYLQRIWLSEDGPMLLDTREIAAVTELKAYITDMRPENSTGIAKQHGFVTYVYLKEDPQAEEPDTWELYVDDFGDAAFTPASN